MKNFKSLALLGCFLLSSCASMEASWIASNCNSEAAYANGMNAGRDEKPMSVDSYASMCPPENRDAVMASYRKGYEAGLASNQSSSTTAPVQNNGTIINLGLGNGNNIGNEGNLGTVNPKAWFCEIKVFGKTYSAFGATKFEANYNAKTSCTVDNHEMHCDRAECIRAR